MNIEILNEQGDVVNAIYATPESAEQLYPGAWRIADVQPELPPVQPKRWLSVLAFRKRYTMTERAAIEWAAVDRPELTEAQRQQAAALRATLADIAVASYIDLDDADTIAGTQMLESMGLIAAGRADEILSAPVLPGELP